MPDEPEWFERLLEQQLLANPELWAGLQQRGVTERTPLRLAFAYLAPGSTEAKGLERYLRAETDYELRSHSQRDGPFAKRDWYVVGVTQPQPVTPDLLDTWVEWMIAAGAMHGPCAFDGWAGHVEEQPAPGA